MKSFMLVALFAVSALCLISSSSCQFLDYKVMSDINKEMKLDWVLDKNKCVEHDVLLRGVKCSKIGDVYRVVKIQMEAMFLRGPISKKFADLPELVELDLSHNALRGEIPKELAKLPKLQFLDLQFNDLTGTVPKEFTKAPMLTRFRVDNNYLTGGMPKGMSRVLGPFDPQKKPKQ